MVSSNLPVWVILLVPLAFWASESFQMVSPGTAKPTSEHVPEQLEIFQTILLKRLGLQRRPDPKPKLLVPQYLMDLYRFSSGQRPASTNDTWEGFMEGRAATANTVRIFHPVEDSAQVSKGAGNSFYFLFNLTLLPLEEELVALELRLYHSPKESQGLFIQVYHAVEPPPVAANKSRLLTCKFVQNSTSQADWVSFDVTAAFQEARERKPNLGLLVEVQPWNCSQDLPHQQTFLRARRSPGQEEAQWTQERPFLVTYTIDQSGQPLTQRKRQSRSRPVRGRRAKKVPAPAWKHKGLRPQMKSSTICAKQELFVDFKAIGWDNWVISPQGLNVSYCSGDCPFPLATHLKPSSHAVVQTILNSVNSAVPKACCVPITFTPVSLLYRDYQGKVSLKNYQDLVVKECGCR